MTRFIQAVRGLSRLFGVVAALLLLAAVLVVNQLVFVRYVLGESAIWQHEFVTFSLIGATFLGCPSLLLSRGHVNVDLLPAYLGGRARVALALLASAVSLAFCLIVAWVGFVWWYEAWVNGWRAATVWARTSVFSPAGGRSAPRTDATRIRRFAVRFARREQSVVHDQWSASAR
ncbi:MAG: TRAP transporter small permease [Kiloniellaceae bacterium]